MYATIEKYIDRLMRESAPDSPLWNIESKELGKQPHWNYIDGCMMTALLRLFEITKNQKYFDFVENFVDFYVFPDGSLRGYDKSTYNLDNINEGRVLFELYKKTGKEKYRLAIELLRIQLLEQPRTLTYNFWHKLIYPEQIWLDGIYMAQPFSLLYQKNFKNADYSDVLMQVTNVFNLMFDKEKGLYYHGIDTLKKAFWADKATGLSKSFWLRSIGWYLVALADLCDLCDDVKIKSKFADILKISVEGIARYLDNDGKMFFQVVDQGKREGNYLETSGSSMVAYAMLKGARLNILDKKYFEIGKSVFDAICEKYLSTNKNGELNLAGICLVAGLGPQNNRRRDGTFEYYVSEPVVENDAKGVAPFILAYTEIKNIV